MKRNNLAVAQLMAMAVGIGAIEDISPARHRERDRDQRTAEDIGDRISKRQAKLARRAKQHAADAQRAEG